MAENIPNPPGGSTPPASSIKKETVRINLPPKPSAAPTIKLPTLPPGGPTAPPSSLPKPAGAPLTTAGSRVTSAPVSAPATTAQRPPNRPASAPSRPVVSQLDVGLAIGAAVAGLIAVASTVYCLLLFKP